MPDQSRQNIFTLLKQGRHIIFLIANAFVVIRPFGAENDIADALAIEMSLIKPQRGDEKPSLGDRFVRQLQRLT